MFAHSFSWADRTFKEFGDEYMYSSDKDVTERDTRNVNRFGLLVTTILWRRVHPFLILFTVEIQY